MGCLFSICLEGCSPVKHQHGWIPPSSGAIKQLKPGITTQEQTLALLGTPTCVGTFDDKTWYYISRITKSYTSFTRPTLLDNKVHMLTFNANGTLECMAVTEKDAIKDVTCVARETPTKGYKPSVFKQMFKNLGRFNAGSAPKH